MFRKLGLKTKIVDLNYAILLEAQSDGVDLDAAWKRAINEALDAFGAPVVCVSFMFDTTYGQLMNVCRYIKETRPDLCVAVGGVGATADPGRILKNELADFVFSNGGEMPLIKFYEYLRSQANNLPDLQATQHSDRATHQFAHNSSAANKHN